MPIYFFNDFLVEQYIGIKNELYDLQHSSPAMKTQKRTTHHWLSCKEITVIQLIQIRNILPRIIFLSL